METEGLLSHSHVPASCPYPEPARSLLCSFIPLPKSSSYYYPPNYVWAFQEFSFPQVAQPKACIRLSSPLPRTYYMFRSSHYSLLVEVTIYSSPNIICTSYNKLLYF